MIENTIGGRYTLQRVLGTGGMGTVYLGIDSTTQKQVAVKALKTEIATPELIERFRREGEALRDLNHPNIVKMLDSFEHDEQQYLVMEYVSGGDLKDLIQTNGKIESQQCINLAIDLADALTRAHRLNIIHRDLKPANVLIGDDGVLRLTDFGVAHVVDKERVTDTDAIVGTIDYLSPEALNGEQIGVGTDIWAFGVMLYEMLTGQRPFQGDSLTATITAILTSPLPDFDALAVDIPTALQDLVYRMLEREVAARISSVRYIGAELEVILNERSGIRQSSTFDTTDTNIDQLTKHNLPADLTSFIGREQEVNAVRDLLSDPNNRLITILAPGGMGKTRLSLQIARDSLDHFKNNVHYIELAPLSDVDSISSAIADAVGYQLQSGMRTAKQQVMDFLGNKTMLLVMDNYEHLPEGFVLVSEILRSAPNVKILVTSRIRLSQPGETVFHLAGMDFPELETPEAIFEYAAVKLFVSSAKRALPTFELTEKDLDHIARICKLVQGMPLGIVLAASWLAALNLKEIAREIQQGIEFLSDETGARPENQRSIEGVFNYSWQQLSDTEQDVFKKSSIFRGGFTREGAQEVTGATLRILMSLVNKSLISRDSSSGRYQIHELLRQFAWKKLQENGSSKDLQKKHAEHYGSLSEQLGHALKTNKQVTALHNYASEIDNIHVAWHWAIKHRISSIILQISDSLWLHQHLFGRIDHAKRLFADAAESFSEKNTVVIGDMLAKQVWFLTLAGASAEEKQDIMSKSLEYLRSAGAMKHLAFALWVAGWSGSVDNPIEVLEEAMSIFKENDDDFGTAQCLTVLTLAYSQHNQVDAAQQAAQSVLSLIESTDLDFFTVGWASYFIGMLNSMSGKIQAATNSMEEANVSFRAINDPQGLFRSHEYLATFYYSSGDFHTALSHSLDALIVSEQQLLPNSIEAVLGIAADTIVELGAVELGNQLFNIYRDTIVSSDTILRKFQKLDINMESSRLTSTGLSKVTLLSELNARLSFLA